MDSWSRSEDRILQKAVMKYGTNQWSRVASLLGRHTAASCRQRWNNALNPKLNVGAWTPEDDRKLIAVHLQMPGMWRSIGLSLGRSSESCVARFRVLTSPETHSLNAPEDRNENREWEGEKSENASKLSGQSVYTGAAEVQSAENKSVDASHSDEDQPTSEEIAANARLSNSMGRKALRKARERKALEDKLNRTRDSKFQSPNQRPATTKLGTGRPRLVLPLPKNTGLSTEHISYDDQRLAAARELSKQLLEKLPPPKHT